MRHPDRVCMHEYPCVTGVCCQHRNLQADVVDCYGDVDSNTVVDVQDVLLVLSNFGLGGPSVADIDLDGDVDVEDILGVLSAFGSPT